MRCGTCGAELPEVPVFPGGSIACAACGAAKQVPSTPPGSLAPPPVSSQVYHDSLCPRCQAPLEIREEDGVVVSACPAHHGLFVAHRVLAELEHESPGTASKLDTDPEREVMSRQETSIDLLLCPQCQGAMAARSLTAAPGVVVDVCELHGTWFDSGELQAAITWRLEGMAPSAVRDPGGMVEHFHAGVLGRPPRQA